MLIAGAGRSALAQETPAASENGGLQEIVVTAQRRSERLEDVPASIQVVTQDDLTKTGNITFDSLDKVSTGTQIGRVGIFTQPAIRGISTSVVGAGQENNVATYIDGFYQADQLALGGDLVNLSDVEILKGPQGTLYGRNATGGAILVNTLDPSSTFDAKVQGTYGRFQDEGGQLYLNMPVASNMAFNVSLNYRQNNGYIRDVPGTYAEGYAPDSNAAPYYSYGARAKLKVDLTDDLEVIVGYNYKFFSDPSADSWYLSRYNIFPIPPGDGVDVVSQAIPNFFNSTSNSPTVKIVYHSPIGILTSHTSYSKLAVDLSDNFNGTPTDFLDAGDAWSRNTFQETLDYDITAIPRLDLLTGLDFLRDSAVSSSWNKFGGVVSGSTLNELRTSSYAAYVNGTYSFTDQLFFSAGVRYTDEIKKFNENCGETIGTCIAGESLWSSGPPTDEKSFVNFSPGGTLRYALTPNSSVYGSISRGFKSGTFDSLNTAQSPTPLPPIQPEIITAYEVGYKGNERGVRIETAAYYYDYKNLQVSQLAVGPGGVLTTVVDNAASARIYGAEASLGVNPLERWRLDLGAAFNHARYTSYPAASADIIEGGFITQGTQNWAGLPLPRAPDWTATATSDYTMPVGAAGKLDLVLNLYYSSSYVPNSDSFDPATHQLLFEQGGYALTNGSLTWTAPHDHFWVMVYANNIFDRRYRIYYGSLPFGAYDVENAPVWYGVRVGYNY
jgi:iron complex outermembrane receptor protein